MFLGACPRSPPRANAHAQGLCGRVLSGSPNGSVLRTSPFGLPFRPLTHPTTTSYGLYANGSLVKDTERDIDSVLCSVQNKPLVIDFGAANDIVYTYDAMGNRLSKTVAGDASVTTYYLRDAQGNVLAVYELAADTVLQKEMHLYGSSRLGLQQAERLVMVDTSVLPLPNTRKTYYQCGFKLYEQSNHLGNVLVTLTDKQRGIDLSSNGSLDYYLATVQTATHYYPFGWELVGMQYGAGYRYGYNGMEKSPEIGNGHHTTFFRENDSRSPVWWSIDPKTTAGESPYVMMGGNPVVGTDVLGDTTRVYNTQGQYLNTYYGKGAIEDHFIEQTVYDAIHASQSSEQNKEDQVRAKSQYFIGFYTRYMLKEIANKAESEDKERAFVMYYLPESKYIARMLIVADISDFASDYDRTETKVEIRNMEERLRSHSAIPLDLVVIFGHVHVEAGGKKIYGEKWETMDKMKWLNAPTQPLIPGELATDYANQLAFGRQSFPAEPALIISKYGYTIHPLHYVRAPGWGKVPVGVTAPSHELMLWGYDGKLLKRHLANTSTETLGRLNIDKE